VVIQEEQEECMIILITRCVACSIVRVIGSDVISFSASMTLLNQLPLSDCQTPSIISSNITDKILHLRLSYIHPNNLPAFLTHRVPTFL